MTKQGATESLEIERKYEVPEKASLPREAEFVQIGYRFGSSATHELRASYFDTDSGELAQQRLAVRCRVGGSDEGWHLKAKGADGAREWQWPLSDEMPAGLRAEIEARLGQGSAERLRRIATLHTTRRTQLLEDADGRQVVELADDQVRAMNELNGYEQQWREWEAELVTGASEDVLDAIEPLLQQAGAARLRGTSKIQRAMSGKA